MGWRHGSSGHHPYGLASIAVLPLPVSIAHEAQPCQGEARAGLWLEQGGGQGYRDAWAGVEQRGSGHAADGVAQTLRRYPFKATLLPRGVTVDLLILHRGLCFLLALVL